MKIMNNIRLLLALFITTSFLVSCEEEAYRDAYTGSEVIYFENSTLDFFVKSNTSTVDIKVISTTKSSNDRTFEVEIDTENSTSGGDAYLANNSFTIPANSYEGMITINGNFDNAVEDGTKLVLNLKSGASAVDNMSATGTSITVNVYKLCESNLAGEYVMTTLFGYHDFLPDFNPSIISVELVAVTENTYEIVGDFTGGLWGDLYAGAYGTSARSVVISDICNMISWDQTTSDQFGGNITYGDSESYYDPSTGNIIISWTCTAYGETGVSTYTPKN
jgi:hypothetical protein